MKTLYLRIYLTVVSVLLVFALIAGWIAQNKLEHEHAKMQAQTAERATAWATLIENSLPGANADPDSQRAALLSWSDRLHVPMALDAVDGHRIATSPLMAGHESPNDPEGRLMRLPLSDGRMLWVWRPSHGPHPEPPTEHGWSLLIPPPWLMGEGLVATLVILFAAIAAGAWPVVRRLTLRLEKLKRGVEQFGAGQLGTRIVIDGKDEVALVAQSFNAAAARIEELIRANKSLLANASHELRSPLARLKMALSMLPDADAAHLDGLQEEIHRDIAELDSLVEEVLLASRLDVNTRLETSPTDALSVAAEEASRVDVPVDVDTPQAASWVVQADERLLRRALRNLLENAKRYGLPPQNAATPPAGEDESPVELRLSQRDGLLTFLVCDRGPGVPESERERIFDPFYRLPGHAEHAGGVGLGLSLVRQIAQRHHGRVRCLPREGGGSCFELTVPVQSG